MDNNFNREDLHFTEEDRKETLHKIKERNHKKRENRTTLFNFGKRYIPSALGSVIAVIIVAVVLLPNINFGNEMVWEDTDKQQVAQQEKSSFSILVTGIDSVDEYNRSNINIVLTYNSSDNSMNIVSIPRDTYVEIFDSEGEMIGRDKLMHASAVNPKPQTAKTTVANLFDIPIEYYAIISEENIYEKLEVTKEDARYNRLTNKIVDLIEAELSATEIKDLLEESKTNLSKNMSNQIGKVNPDSIQVIDLGKEAEEKFINGVYYVDINEELLGNTSTTLRTHLSKH
ncbi:LCP family protein [Virgibacillus sp. W0181]|uniref:LCP family protein n=1 Tax=Virgibacillus sp. W0181 TaxID=3391581 RepID=UPI003F46A511